MSMESDEREALIREGIELQSAAARGPHTCTKNHAHGHKCLDWDNINAAFRVVEILGIETYEAYVARATLRLPRRGAIGSAVRDVRAP